MPKSPSPENEPEQVAGNGLLHRRVFLSSGAALLSAGSLGLLSARPAVAQAVPGWSRVPGDGLSAYGERSPFEDGVTRGVLSAPGTVGAGSSRTPLEALQGTITPNSLHFERHHNGIPDIDPALHQLLIHGLVDRPLVFSMDALYRYPMESRIQFLECSGNSRTNLGTEPPTGSCGDLHGLISCSEWTGVPLSLLLDEAGVASEGRWILAEGADAAVMTRSIPMAKALDDALVALYQNGERLRPSQGYPVRLFLPGYEGNMSIKWLRRLKIIAEPSMTREETSKYTDLLPSGQALQFTFSMGVKSLITSPSGGQVLDGPGLYEITGIAWSGAGRIRAVEVSADGGETWAEAALTEPGYSKSVARFRMAWRRDGGPAVLMSRAIDETGAVQPTRGALIAEKGTRFNYHVNSIQAWHVTKDGTVRNVHA
ncbi:MAG: sulfite dehydrogenase [Candidatus Rariloculaceae bacterium]